METTSNPSDQYAEEWRSLVEPLEPITGHLLNLLSNKHDPLVRHELYQFLFSQVAVAYLGRLYNNPDYPDFVPMYSSIFNQGFPNPDDTIAITPIRGEGHYKISGVRGSVRHVTFQVGSGTLIPYGTGTYGPSLADYNIDTATIADNGSFEVVLSPERPADYDGDWWYLDEKATYIVVRQRAYDWMNEVDGRFAIERIDIPAVRPRPDVAYLKENLAAVSQWTEMSGRMSLDGPWVKNLREANLVNRVTTKNYAAISGHAKQFYVEGLYDIKEDEALILETAVPESCTYWGFHLTDELWRSIDWYHRQSSLNGFTAHIDSDGRLRIVISQRDPGVANWLDTAERERGIIYGRWTECDDIPQPTMIKVKIADVRTHLPADTQVIDLETRDQMIRQRCKAAQMRKRW
jgi:hypothetical protein